MGEFGPVACIAISDLHLTLTTPSCRSEKDWPGTMARYFRQVKDYHDRVSEGTTVPIPIVCAGDVFDRPNPPVELVNWAIRTLPTMYAVPGQHDLPFHDLKAIRKSGYWTLVEAGVLIDLVPSHPVGVGNVRLHGFPWGTKIVPWDDNHGLALEIAVVHKYVWLGKKGYPGAPKEARAERLQDSLRGYDIAVVGDNHKPFDVPHGDLCSLMNCGAFLRRKRDEMDHHPSIVVIYTDGRCGRHFLDVRGDSFVDMVIGPTTPANGINEFVESLGTLDGNKVDFAEALKRAADDHADEKVRAELWSLLEDI